MFYHYKGILIVKTLTGYIYNLGLLAHTCSELNTATIAIDCYKMREKQG